MSRNPFVPDTVTTPYPITGRVGESRSSLLGSQVGSALGQVLSNRHEQGQAVQDWNPMREALLRSMATQATPLTPQQSTLRSIATDPVRFAKVMSDPDQQAALTRMSEAGTAPENKRIVVVTGKDPIGKELGLGADERARAELTLGADNRVVNASLASVSEPSTSEGSGMFGAGAEGKALEILTNLAPVIASGQATPDQRRMFEVAGYKAREPVTYLNPITGKVEQRSPKLPPQIERLLQPMDTGGAPATPGAGGGEPAATPAPATSASPAQGTLPSGSTVWDQVPNLVGISAGIRRTVEGLPVVGKAPTEATTAPPFLVDLNNRLISAIRKSPRWTEGEREDLAKTVAFKPELLKNPDAGSAAVVQWALNVDNRIKQHAEIIGTPNLTLEDRRQRIDTLNEMMQVREQIAPPIINNDDEAAQFRASHPPGTVVLMRDPDQPGKQVWIRVVTE